MVSIDGCGEQQSTVVYDSNFNILKEYLWQMFTWFLLWIKCTRKLGYKELQDEYIIMGMSSYGEVSQKHLKILNDHWDMIMSIPSDKKKKIVGRIQLF